MANRVTVKIFGQDYTICGDKTDEEIQRIAEYVDNKMRLINKVANDTSKGNLAILSAINIAEEYFDALKQVEQVGIAKAQLENDSKYYLKMWEDAKANFIKYKESITEMKNRQQEETDKIEALKAKCTEYENSFFDLQMENIQLKSELEKLKR